MSFQFQDLKCELGGRVILKSVSGDIPAGKITAVLGPNGCGKSTLLRCLLGLIESKGERNPRIENKPRRAGYLPQIKEIHWPLTCENVVRLGNEADPDLIMGKIGIDYLKNKPVNQISGGERTLVLLARALAGKPDYIVADEPAAELDPAFQLHVLNVLKEEAARGAAVLITMHDVNLTARFCDHVYLMREGKIEAEGAAGILNSANLNKIFGVNFSESKGIYAG